MKALQLLLFLLFFSNAQAQLGIASFTRPSCPSCADGSITAMASGTAGPFTYLWSTGAATQSISGLPPGNYTVQIRNRFYVAGVNECPSWPFTVSLGPCTSNETINVEASIYHCDAPNSADGSINLTVQGGTGAYIYAWKKNGTPITGGTTYLSNLSPGTYTVTISNGCTSVTRNYEVKSCNQNEGPRPSFDPNLAQPIPCDEFHTPAGAGGRLGVLEGSEFWPFTYQWSGPNGFQGNTQSVILNGSGQYCVTVTDKCGRTNSICRTINCCNVDQVPYGVANRPCLGYVSGFYPFTSWNDSDGEITIQTPRFYDPNSNGSNYQPYPCNNEFEVTWPDGRTSQYNNVTGWTGQSSFTVTSDNGGVPYEITITNSCGCSRTSYISFGYHNHQTFETVEYTSLMQALYQFMPGYSTSVDPYWNNLNPDVIQSCGTCEKHCDAQIFCNNGSNNIDYFEYTTPDPSDPCRGGEIRCPATGFVYSVPMGVTGQPFVDYSATPTSVGNGLCRYPAGCLFEPGLVPSLQHLGLPVFVRSLDGFVVASSDCDLVDPPDPECPNGSTFVSLGITKDCEQKCACKAPNGETIDIMTCGTFEEGYWDYCECLLESGCKIFKRCNVASYNPEPAFGHEGDVTDCSTWPYIGYDTIEGDCNGVYQCYSAKGVQSNSRSLTNGNSMDVASEYLQEMMVKPNPSHDQFTIFFPNLTEATDIEIRILDQNSKQVFGTTRKLMTNQDYITLHTDGMGLPAGLYFVQAKANNQVYVEKIIKL